MHLVQELKNSRKCTEFVRRTFIISDTRERFTEVAELPARVRERPRPPPEREPRPEQPEERERRVRREKREKPEEPEKPRKRERSSKPEKPEKPAPEKPVEKRSHKKKVVEQPPEPRAAPVRTEREIVFSFDQIDVEGDQTEIVVDEELLLQAEALDVAVPLEGERMRVAIERMMPKLGDGF
jgi:hypothetical protein